MEEITTNYFVRQRNIFYIKDLCKCNLVDSEVSTYWVYSKAFLPYITKLTFDCKKNVYDVAKFDRIWKISIEKSDDDSETEQVDDVSETEKYYSTPENIFNIPIKDSRGFDRTTISIFSSPSYTIVAVLKGKFNTTCEGRPPEPVKGPEDSPEPVNEPEDSPEPVDEPKSPNENVETPQKSPERSATTWAIIVIVLIVLSGLAFIAWRYFRGQNPNVPFFGENNSW